MTLTVAERIESAVVALLAGVRTAAGFRFVARAESAKEVPVTPSGEVYFLVSAGDPTLAAEQPINLDDYEQEYRVTYEIESSEFRTDRTVAGLRATVAGEVKRAVMAGNNGKVAGLAIRTFGWEHATNPTGGSGAIEGEVTFTIHYRTLQDNPFASAFEPQP